MSYKSTRRTVPKGELVLLSHGEYSDYQLILFGRALVDINLDDLDTGFSRVKDDCPLWWEKFTRFASWMVQNGLIEELKYQEIHLSKDGNNSGFKIYTEIEEA